MHLPDSARTILDERGVAYALIGAIAASVHGTRSRHERHRHALLEFVDRTAIIEHVDAHISALPRDAQKLWTKVRAELVG